MRQISDASLAALQQTSGLEPVIIVKVWWGGTTAVSYCDRQYQTEGLVGRLVDITGIEDVIDINAAASSVSLSVTLDDAIGDIKAIINVIDIHKKRVQILQWFSNLPLSEAFPIFEGVIYTPIVWSEGARTLKFDVVSKLEDLEVGFSAEEGKFQFIPSNIIGQAWPLVFGTVAGVKAIPLTESPSAVFAQGFAIVHDLAWQTEMADLQNAINDAYTNMVSCYQLGIDNAIIAGAYKQFGSLPDDPNQALQYDNAAQQYYAQSSQYAQQYIELTGQQAIQQALWDKQKTYAGNVVKISQTNFPNGLSVQVEFDNYTADAVVINDQMVLTNIQPKPLINFPTGTNAYNFQQVIYEYKKEFRDQKFIWIDGGTQIKIFNYPRYFIAALGHVNIINVWARNRFGRAVVPPEWYTVDHASFPPQDGIGPTLDATRIIFSTPLESRPGEWQDSDIEIDCSSDIGTNVVDIMLYLINTYSKLSYDQTSFDHVRTLVANYPANFALTSRKQLVQCLQEIAFQSRCAIWINDNKFYLRYLPEKLTPVDTITDADVEVNSLVLTCTETERIVTKFTATWRERVNQDSPNKIIYRYNIQNYGLHEETYDFYIYNNHDLVAKSAEFWMIRKSNTWKLLQFKAMLHKLRLETFDPVEIDFSEMIASSDPVTGTLQKATYDPTDNTIAMEVWMPVRFGEMTEYPFAQPMEVQDYYPVLTDPNIKTGNPFDNAYGVVAPQYTFAPYQQLTFSTLNPFTQGRGVPIGDFEDAPGNLITALTPSNVDQSRPIGIESFNDETRRKINPITPVTITPLKPGTFYGEVVAAGETAGTFSVSTYFNGLTADPTTITVAVKKIPSDETLNAGYPLQVHRAVFVDPVTGLTKYEYWAQPPIWVENEVDTTP